MAVKKLKVEQKIEETKVHSYIQDFMPLMHRHSVTKIRMANAHLPHKIFSLATTFKILSYGRLNTLQMHKIIRRTQDILENQSLLKAVPC